MCLRRRRGSRTALRCVDQVTRAGTAAGQAARGYVGAASRRQVPRPVRGRDRRRPSRGTPSEGHRRACPPERDASSTRLRGRPGHAQRGAALPASRPPVLAAGRKAGTGRCSRSGDANHIRGHRRDVDAALRIAEPQQIAATWPMRCTPSSNLHNISRFARVMRTTTAGQRAGQPGQGGRPPPRIRGPLMRVPQDGVEQHCARPRAGTRPCSRAPRTTARSARSHHGPPTAEQVGGRT